MVLEHILKTLHAQFLFWKFHLFMRLFLSPSTCAYGPIQRSIFKYWIIYIYIDIQRLNKKLDNQTTLV
jgi:hypothetical protein